MLPREVRTPAGAAAGHRESVRKGGGETYTSHPHWSSNGLLGPHLCMGPEAKSSHSKEKDDLGKEMRAFELQ